MKGVVAAFNQEKALVGAFSVITNLRMELFQAVHLAISLVFLIKLTRQQEVFVRVPVNFIQLILFPLN